MGFVPLKKKRKEMQLFSSFSTTKNRDGEFSYCKWIIKKKQSRLGFVSCIVKEIFLHYLGFLSYREAKKGSGVKKKKKRVITRAGNVVCGLLQFSLAITSSPSEVLSCLSRECGLTRLFHVLHKRGCKKKKTKRIRTEKQEYHGWCLLVVGVQRSKTGFGGVKTGRGDRVFGTVSIPQGF